MTFQDQHIHSNDKKIRKTIPGESKAYRGNAHIWTDVELWWKLDVTAYFGA